MKISEFKIQLRVKKIAKPNSIISYFYKAMGNQTCFVSAYNLNSQGVATNLLYPINTQNMTNGSKTFTFTYTGTGRQYLSFAFYITNHTNPLATRFFTIDNFTVKFTGNYPFTETVALYDGKDYRYEFNGMEKDDEIKGSGNSYDFGARMYDSRLGRWWSVDPKDKLLPHISAYHYGKNCPIKNIDNYGETVEGANEESFARLQNHIIKVFNGHDLLIGLFKQMENTLQFEAISEKDFIEAVKDISDPNIRALANGYFEAINSTKLYSFILVHNDKRIIDEPGIDKNINFDKIAKNVFENTGAIFIEDNGGGAINSDAGSTILFNESIVASTVMFTAKSSSRVNRNVESGISRALLSAFYNIDPFIKNKPKTTMDKEIIKFQLENLSNRAQGTENVFPNSLLINEDRKNEGYDIPKELELNITIGSVRTLDRQTVKPTK